MPRPPSENPRDRQVNMRLTQGELEEAQAMARELGTSVSDAMRDGGLRDMRKRVAKLRRDATKG